VAGSTRQITHRGRSGRRRYTPMAEINVTPFVDVMLVLLIVFMISAPLLTAGVPVDLPKADAKPLLGDDEPITVTVDPSGKLYLQETEITLEEIVPKLIAIAKAGYDERIYVRGDRTVEYGNVMNVMAALSSAGFRHVGLVTLPEPKS
jgi:biopolymer transport protein TolR